MLCRSLNSWLWNDQIWWCMHIALLCMRTILFYWTVIRFEVSNENWSSISIITYDAHITLGSILVKAQIRIFTWLRFPKPYTWWDHMHNIRNYNVCSSSIILLFLKPTYSHHFNRCAQLETKHLLPVLEWA